MLRGRLIGLALVLAALACIASGDNPCTTLWYKVDCVECHAFHPDCFHCPMDGSCRYLPYPSETALDNRFGTCTNPIYQNATCPEADCVWAKITTSKRPCAPIYHSLLIVTVVAILVSLLFTVLVNLIGRAPWLFWTFEQNGICPFSLKRVNGATTCSRCGVACHTLRRIGFGSEACYGCAALVVSRKLLLGSYIFEAGSLLVFWFDLSQVIAVFLFFILAGLSMFSVLFISHKLIRLRRFVFTGAPSGYSAIGVRAGPADLPDEQMAMLQRLPERHRTALLHALRMDEDVLWVGRPNSWLAGFTLDFAAREEVTFFLYLAVPLLIPGLLFGGLAGAWGFLFAMFILSCILGSIGLPSAVASIMRCHASYVLTTNRVLIVHPMLYWVVANSTSYSTISRIQVVNVPVRTGSPASALLTLYKGTTVLGSLTAVSDVDRALQIVTERCAALPAVPAAANGGRAAAFGSLSSTSSDQGLPLEPMAGTAERADAPLTSGPEDAVPAAASAGSAAVLAPTASAAASTAPNAAPSAESPMESGAIVNPIPALTEAMRLQARRYSREKWYPAVGLAIFLMLMVLLTGVGAIVFLILFGPHWLGYSLLVRARYAAALFLLRMLDTNRVSVLSLPDGHRFGPSE